MVHQLALRHSLLVVVGHPSQSHGFERFPNEKINRLDYHTLLATSVISV